MIHTKIKALAPSKRMSLKALSTISISKFRPRLIGLESEAKNPGTVCDQTAISPWIRMIKGRRLVIF